MIKRFIHYYKPHKKLFIADMICSLVLAFCDLFYPMITRSMINDFIPNRQIRLLIVWAVALLGIYLLKMALNYFVQYYGHLVGVGMQADMRRDVFRHLQKLPFTYFDNHKTGTIMSRIINDLMDISELAHHGPENLFIAAILLAGSFILLAQINIWLTLIIFLSMPVLIFFAMKKRVKLGEAFTRTRKEVGEVNATLENAISGIRVSKAFTNQAVEEERFARGNENFVKARTVSYKVMGEFHAGTTFITDYLYVVVLLAGGLFTYHGLIDFGDLTAYLLYVGVFLNPIRSLIGFIEQFQNGMSGFRRYCEIMDQPVEEELPNAEVMEQAKGDIAFEDVTFSYAPMTDGDEPDEDAQRTTVFSGLSFRVPRGETVALVGPSGGGKTTICHIIPRFYEIDSGRVTLDGQDIRTLTRESLRRQIGIVQQDVFLFTGTIYENILYGRPDATREEVYEAARRANIHEFIQTLEEGYDTYIGERGVKLSGGQKQRISIARVFLKNPPILILDEATSALDNATEAMIQESLEELCHGRTTIVVAHRLSTIRNADEILVIGNSGITEQGSHAQLMELDGAYAALYRSQFKHLQENNA